MGGDGVRWRHVHQSIVLHDCAGGSSCNALWIGGSRGKPKPKCGRSGPWGPSRSAVGLMSVTGADKGRGHFKSGKGKPWWLDFFVDEDTQDHGKVVGDGQKCQGRREPVGKGQSVARRLPGEWMRVPMYTHRPCFSIPKFAEIAPNLLPHVQRNKFSR